MKTHLSNALSGNLCLTFQLSAWTLHHQCFQMNCVLSFCYFWYPLTVSSLPPHFQSTSHFIVRNVRICIWETPPVIKIPFKTWPLTSRGISAQLFQKLQISSITEKKCVISTDILKVTFMILICFDLCNLFVCRKWPTKREAKSGRVWECARVRKHKLWSDRLLNNCCDCHSWLNLLIVSFTGGFLRTHSYNSCDVSL